MEFNKKQIDTTLIALEIAKAVAEVEYSKRLIAIKLGLSDQDTTIDHDFKELVTISGKPANVKFLETQVSLIEQIEDFDKMIKNFTKIASREEYQSKEE